LVVDNTKETGSLSLPDEDTKFLIQAGKRLHEGDYKEGAYNKVKTDIHNRFNSTIGSRKKLLEGVQRAQSNIIGGENLRSTDSGMSEAGQALVEKIRNELAKAFNKDSFFQSYETSKELIAKIKDISEAEKGLVKFNLEVIKTIAMDDYVKNGRLASSKPKCKWHQWACVFYMSTAQLHVLALFQLFNGTYELDNLVSTYSIAYIAQCCGFCGCSCKDGCPRFL
jgi:hypothetical protein